jgi:hypothetical protein
MLASHVPEPLTDVWSEAEARSLQALPPHGACDHARSALLFAVARDMTIG